MFVGQRATLVLNVLLVGVVGCSPKEAALDVDEPAPTPAPRGFSAELSAHSDGTWDLTYRFDKPHAALLFDSSGADRVATWKPSISGVAIENLSGLDVLLLDPPASEARFTIAPSKDVQEGTAPFLHFSDGSVAVHTGQFTVLTIKDRSEAAALGGSLRRWRGEQPTITTTLRAQRPLLTPDGLTVRGEVRMPLRGGGGYVYVGDISPTKTDDFAAIVDPGLPGWLAGRIGDDLRQIYAAHRARWGEGADKATILLAFGGGGKGFHNKGFASGRQLSMAIRGDDYTTKNADALGELLWFFAHEAAHQFQFRGGVNREPGSEWIYEGAANAMAHAILADIGMRDKRQLEVIYWNTHRRCIAELKDGPLSGKRGQAGYVCGDLIAQITASSLPSGELFGFWNALRDAAKRADDGSITSARYFALMSERGIAQDVIEATKRLVHVRLDDGDAVLTDAMRAAGLAPVFADDGSLSSMKFPVALGSGASKSEP